MKQNRKLHNLFQKYLGSQIVKAGIWYTIGNYLLKGIGFITVPIFARLMTQEDFGYYNTFMAYEGIIYLFISLALHVSLKNAKYEYGDDRLDDYTSSVSLIPILALALALILANIFFPFANKLLDLDRLQTNLLLIYCYASGVLIYYHNRVALDYKYKEYLKLSYINSLSNIVISIVLMLTVFYAQRYFARILASVISLSIVTIYIVVSLWKKAKPRIASEYWKFGLKLSLPIIPHGIGQVVLLSFDRIMITRYVGARESGIYSFAYTIFTIVQITANSISTVFEPWAYKRLSENKIEIVQKRATQFFYLICCIAATVILVAPEMILILGSGKYSESIYCVIPVMIGGAFSMAFMIPSVLTYYKKKTQLIPIGTIVAALLNILLNYIFIAKYGYVAAAYTTLVCYILYFVFHCIIAEKASGIRMIKIWHILLGFGIVMCTAVLTFATLHRALVRAMMFALFIIIAGTYIYGMKKRKDID